jgi:hypothetical protein
MEKGDLVNINKGGHAGDSGIIKKIMLTGATDWTARILLITGEDAGREITLYTHKLSTANSLKLTEPNAAFKREKVLCSLKKKNT